MLVKPCGHLPLVILEAFPFHSLWRRQLGESSSL